MASGGPSGPPSGGGGRSSSSAARAAAATIPTGPRRSVACAARPRAVTSSSTRPGLPRVNTSPIGGAPGAASGTTAPATQSRKPLRTIASAP